MKYVRILSAAVWMHFVALLALMLWILSFGTAEPWIRSFLIARASLVLLAIFGVRVERDGAVPLLSEPAVWICNHRSSLDIFIILSLGLPRTRYFLSSFLQKVPAFSVLGRLLGCFWIMDQDQPQKRVEVFKAAADVLRRTGEDVFLTPEGRRIDSRLVGTFNKGSFHLAIDLGRPILPIYIETPDDTSPGTGWNAKPGVVSVRFLDLMKSPRYSEHNLRAFVEEVRGLYIREGSKELKEVLAR